MHDFLVLMGRHVLEGIAPVGKIAVPRDINRAAPDAGDGVHDEDHVHDENGIERRSGARIVDALDEFLDNGHLTLLGVIIALMHLQRPFGIALAQDAQRLAEGLETVVEMILQKIEELRRARSLHENDMPAYRGRLIADALHIHHDAQRRDHKAEIPGHGLGAGEDTQLRRSYF